MYLRFFKCLFSSISAIYDELLWLTWVNMAALIKAFKSQLITHHLADALAIRKVCVDVRTATLKDFYTICKL